jgi:hypothetical protein
MIYQILTFQYVPGKDGVTFLVPTSNAPEPPKQTKDILLLFSSSRPASLKNVASRIRLNKKFGNLFLVYSLMYVAHTSTNGECMRVQDVYSFFSKK